MKVMYTSPLNLPTSNFKQDREVIFLKQSLLGCKKSKQKSNRVSHWSGWLMESPDPGGRDDGNRQKGLRVSEQEDLCLHSPSRILQGDVLTENPM